MSAPTSDKPALGAGSALLAYLALLVGQLIVGAGAQQRSIVVGLWVTEAVAIALPAIIVLRGAGLRFAPYLGLRSARPGQFLVAAVASAANQPVVSFLTWAAREILPGSLVASFDAKQRLLDAIFAVHALPMTITVVIAAPLGEELFFRGFAFPALQRSLGLAAAVVVSGILFSVLHMDPVGFIGLMEIGILLAALRHWTGSLWPAVLAHAVNNGLAGGAFLLGFEDPDIPPPWWVLALGAALLVVGLVLLVRLLRQPSPVPPREEPAGEGPRGFRFSRAAGLLLFWFAAVVAGVVLLVRP
jgi:membrane protease YdiL (CAAX protease family)